MSFVPNDDVGSTNFIEAGPAREECVDDWGEMLDILKNEVTLRMMSSRMLCRKTKLTIEVGGGGCGWGKRPLATRAEGSLGFWYASLVSSS